MKKVISQVFGEIHDSTKLVFKVKHKPTGIMELDFYTGGLAPGKLYVLAGAPRSFKTSLLLSISFNMGVLYDIPLLYCSMDASQETLVKRILFQYTNCNIQTFPYESPNLFQMRKLFAAGNKLKQSKLKFLCSTVLKIEDIGKECAFIENKGILFIDYFQVLVYGEKYSEVLQKLKMLASEFGIPVLVAYQTCIASRLNTAFFISNGVDAVFRIKKERSYDISIEDENIDGEWHVFFEIVKNRNGKCATFELLYEEKSLKFYNEKLDLFECDTFPHEFESIASC